ncbi:hypothetical protein VTP01DRAFT_6906 [Rhizomucor pusillus]|uniref:uncharacterized protein n=1 Tax=Rhizomucor pusillus TaxID=4840 RepID=UPI003742B2EC
MEETVSSVAAVLGGFVLVYGLCSLIIKEKLYISEALVAVSFGVLVGPVGVGLIDVTHWQYKQDFTQQFSRIVIALQVMAAGVALPKAYLRKEMKSLLILLGPTMIWMWIISGLCVYLLFPGLSFLQALMIASCFTPTDPVLANLIVHGHFAEKHVPTNVRHIISAESGANDGLGYPFLFLATYLIQQPTATALNEWTLHVMLYEICFSVVLGFVAGYVARKLLKFAQKKRLVDHDSFTLYAIALASFLMGFVGLLGSDDLLACFIAGNSFTWDDWFRIETEDSRLVESIDMMLNLSIFIYIGIIMPWDSFTDASLNMSIWRLLLLAVLVHLFRRLPVVTALYKFIPAIRTWREAVFTGWFGPMGVGSVFYCTVAIASFAPDGPNAYALQLIEPIVYFIVLSSVLVHGITVPLFHIGKIAHISLSFTAVSVKSSEVDEETLIPASPSSYGAINANTSTSPA